MLFYDPIYSSLELPSRHRFPISKYHKLKTRLANSELESHIKPVPQKASHQQLSRCHSQDYIKAFCHGTMTSAEIKRMGFPWSKQLVERTLTSVGASIAASNHALKHGFAANLAGGYHHAFGDRASGFCIFNDLAIAACELLETGLVDSVLILDCDVHQGDGTASILQSHANIVTCSLHCEQNFPRLKESSDYDFALPSGTQDSDYLTTLKQAMDLCVRMHRPDIILYNAGADICDKDELGHFNISLQGVFNRETFILDYCYEHQIPLMCALGGGYQRDTDALVTVHQQLFNALTASPYISSQN
ncbi:histone deacetylase family protein [Pseudoalteromonas luteoviolacea]|uniref:histone deacetylase family protein n=1 Tax=Pseudoalteromonas luteoviolacea TaxID=43657 RepID=UPI001B39C4AF|nr:histone deacetylase [Pseudoalteromonas luteoviolacea]MBQ4836221.1 histone deacetylase [Pseudoalteromonas luteoviolacea]